MLIGDSVAQRKGVDVFKESFGRVLEKKANSPSKKIEVIIMAVSGYSTSQELILLQEKAFQYNPDLIIWSYVMNDPAHPAYHDANGELGRYYYRPKIFSLDFLSMKLFLLNEKTKSLDCEKEMHKFLHCVYWDEIQGNIEQIGTISATKETPIMFLILPIFEKAGYGNYSLSDIHTKLAVEATKSYIGKSKFPEFQEH